MWPYIYNIYIYNYTSLLKSCLKKKKKEKTNMMEKGRCMNVSLPVKKCIAQRKDNLDCLNWASKRLGPKYHWNHLQLSCISHTNGLLVEEKENREKKQKKSSVLIYMYLHNQRLGYSLRKNMWEEGVRPNVRPTKVYWAQVVPVVFFLFWCLFFRERIFQTWDWAWCWWAGPGSWSALCWWRRLVDVLREPAEALAITLSLQHAAHEHLQRSCVQLLHRDIALETRPSALANISISPRTLAHADHVQFTQLISTLPLGLWLCIESWWNMALRLGLYFQLCCGTDLWLCLMYSIGILLLSLFEHPFNTFSVFSHSPCLLSDRTIQKFHAVSPRWWLLVCRSCFQGWG